MSTADRSIPEPKQASRCPVSTRLSLTGKELPSRLLILDPDLIREIIRDRQEQGIDRYDEVWGGIYIVPPLANMPHQGLVLDLSVVL